MTQKGPVSQAYFSRRMVRDGLIFNYDFWKAF